MNKSIITYIRILVTSVNSACRSWLNSSLGEIRNGEYIYWIVTWIYSVIVNIEDTRHIWTYTLFKTKWSNKHSSWLNDSTYLTLALQEHFIQNTVINIPLDVVRLPKVLWVVDSQSISHRAVHLNFSPVRNKIHIICSYILHIILTC